MRSSPVVLDQVHVAFDDQRMVANAGLLLPATPMDQSREAHRSAWPLHSPEGAMTPYGR
jgi:hypothetical protein